MMTSSILPFDQRGEIWVDTWRPIIIELGTFNSFRVPTAAFLVWIYSAFSLNRECTRTETPNGHELPEA
jgi:hypothetical protein